jgi:dephospho-CoA kinase
LEAALLQETNFITRFQQIWVVETYPAIAIARLGRRNQFTPEEAKARLNAQLNNEARRKQADVLIENNGSLPALHQQVDAILTKMAL